MKIWNDFEIDAGDGVIIKKPVINGSIGMNGNAFKINAIYVSRFLEHKANMKQVALGRRVRKDCCHFERKT